MIDASYIAEILRDMPPGLTPEEFLACCQPDINDGYRAEVAEALRRYISLAPPPPRRA